VPDQLTVRRAAGDVIDHAQIRQKVDVAVPSGKIVQGTGVIDECNSLFVLFRVEPDLPRVSPCIAAKALRLFLIASQIPVYQLYDPAALEELVQIEM